MVHASILFLIISGVINSIRFYPQYVLHRPLAIALWHTHMFLAVIVFVISFWSLAGKEPPASHRAAATVNVILLLLLVAVSSTLQYVRQMPVSQTTAASGGAIMPYWLYDIVYPLSRWLHIVCTTLIVGGTLFFELVLPIAIEDLKREQQLYVFARRGWFSAGWCGLGWRGC